MAGAKKSELSSLQKVRASLKVLKMDKLTLRQTGKLKFQNFKFQQLFLQKLKIFVNKNAIKMDFFQLNFSATFKIFKNSLINENPDYLPDSIVHGTLGVESTSTFWRLHKGWLFWTLETYQTRFENF